MPRLASGSSSAISARIWRSSSIRASPEWQSYQRNRATTFAAPQLQAARTAKQRLEARANVGEANAWFGLLLLVAWPVVSHAQHELFPDGRRRDLDRARL